MHPKEISIADYTYTLPQDKIAQQPLSNRDQSKLLLYKNEVISQDVFSNIADHLPKNTTLVFNDTKVIHARILFRNSTGATIEVFLLEPSAPFRDMQLAMYQRGKTIWRCMIGNAKKWRDDFLAKKIIIGIEEIVLEVRQKEKMEDDYQIEFSWGNENHSFSKILEAAGEVPLPPYIKRDVVKADEEHYQTVYASQDGSVAAPTAGLHFSENIFGKLKSKNIHSLFVTLHLNAGTFLPVKSDTMSNHHMHGEQIVLHKETIELLIETFGNRTSGFLKTGSSPIIAVGTTSARTLESLYWLGLKISRGEKNLTLDQWFPYEHQDSPITIHESLNHILSFLKEKKLNQLVAETKLLIAPGYPFKIIDGIITNFHMPQSTLLLLVAALIGEPWRKVYKYAMENDFRFLSYGDGSLLFR